MVEGGGAHKQLLSVNGGPGSASAASLPVGWTLAAAYNDGPFPSDPGAPMPIPVVCAACQTKLVAPDAAAGKKVKCKNCQAVIPVPEPEESDFEFVDTAPKPVAAKPIAAKPVLAVAVPAKPKPAVVAPGEYHDEFAFDDAPKPKKKSKAAIVLDDDEPKPSKKKKAALLDDEEDDEDEAPRKGQKGKRKPEKKKSNAPMFVALGVVAIMAVGAIGGAVWYFAIRDDKVGTAGTKPGSAAAPAKDPLAGWTKHEKPGFSVYFKDSVGAAVPQSVTQAGVKVEGLTAGAGPTSRHGFVMVMNELPPAAFAALLQNPAAAFDGGIRGMLRDGKLLSQKDITFEGHPGREVRLTQKDGSEGILRMVLAHNRLYVFGVIEPGITEASETYGTFFNNATLKP